MTHVTTNEIIRIIGLEISRHDLGTNEELYIIPSREFSRLCDAAAQKIIAAIREDGEETGRASDHDDGPLHIHINVTITGGERQ